MENRRLYKVMFHNEGKVYEVYARDVEQSHVYGFVDIVELLFGEQTTVVVDPSEERLKSEFKGVKRSMIPVHAIIRIDQVESTGTSKISDASGNNVTPFPTGGFPPRSTPRD